MEAHDRVNYAKCFGVQGYYQQPNHASQGYQQQAWQPAGYQPSGYAQPQLPMGAQQGCGSLVLAIVEIVRKVFKF